MTRSNLRSTKVPRNAPCPCGSGRKYKHCCGDPRLRDRHKRRVRVPLLDAFIEIPSTITTYLLDTCVWGEIVKSASVADAFIEYFEANNLLAGLSMYTVFELSRADRLLSKLDTLFFRGRKNIWIPLLYDQLQELELSSYPTAPAMRWMPIAMICDETQTEVLGKLVADRRFTNTRDEHLQFGYTEFMGLERFKENYPPDEEGHYSPAQAQDFSRLNALDFFERRLPDFLRRFKPDTSSLDTSRIWSVQMRSLLLFYKYYIHHQSPQQSDFLDFAAASYVPYVDVYVTERNVLNALRHIQSSSLMLSNTELIHVADFVSGFERTIDS